MYSLFLLCLFVSIYDLRYRRVPNWITLPLLLIGIVANVPGAPALWMGSILMLTAWGSGWMGGGDIKLWLGLLWCTSSFYGESVSGAGSVQPRPHGNPISSRLSSLAIDHSREAPQFGEAD